MDSQYNDIPGKPAANLMMHTWQHESLQDWCCKAKSKQPCGFCLLKTRELPTLTLDSKVSTDAQQPFTTVCDELAKKHPSSQPAHPSTLLHLTANAPDIHPILFGCIDGTAIHSAAICTNGTWQKPRCVSHWCWWNSLENNWKSHHYSPQDKFIRSGQMHPTLCWARSWKWSRHSHHAASLWGARLWGCSPSGCH